MEPLCIVACSTLVLASGVSASAFRGGIWRTSRLDCQLPMRFLCISDLHGNAQALQAVLAAAERRGYARLLVAGDLCFPGPAPLATWRLLMTANATCAQGLGDRALAAIDLTRVSAKNEHESARLELLRKTREELGELIVARLGKLPPQVRIPLPNGAEMLLVHGSPADPTEGISHEMDEEEVSALIGDDPADIIVCGATHVPFDRTVTGVRIINVGSVGEAPGGAFAHATFIEITPTGVEVEQLSVPIEAAALAFEIRSAILVSRKKLRLKVFDAPLAPSPTLEVMRRKLGGREAGSSDALVGALVQVEGRERGPGVVLFVEGEHVHVWVGAGLVRKVARGAVSLSADDASSELSEVARDVRAFAQLREGDAVSFLSGTAGERLQYGRLIEKCRYGVLVAKADGTILGVGFRRVWLRSAGSLSIN